MDEIKNIVEIMGFQRFRLKWNKKEIFLSATIQCLSLD